MITLNILGTYQGDADNRSYPGMAYLRVKPIATPPPGLLRAVKCRKPFGPPEDGTQRLGDIAVLCEPTQIPKSIDVGDVIAFAAQYWLVSQPNWSERAANLVHGHRISPVVVLDGEIKSAASKAVPFTFSARVQYLSRMLSNAADKHIDARCLVPDAPPAWLLREMRVPKSANGRPNGFVQGMEELSPVTFQARQGLLPKLERTELMDITGAFWPISEPYYSEDDAAVINAVIPDPVLIVQSAKAVKQTAEASVKS